MSKSLRRVGIILLVLIPWLLLTIAIGGPVWRDLQCGFPLTFDIARRVTAPDESKTAVLVRVIGFDMNYRLYIVKGNVVTPSCEADELWISTDFNPDTRLNLHEDLQWSNDSSIIAVTIEGQYTYAYNFSSEKEVDDPVTIQSLLEFDKSP